MVHSPIILENGQDFPTKLSPVWKINGGPILDRQYLEIFTGPARLNDPAFDLD